MIWKNWPYWLKGGIIGVIVAILIGIIIFKIIGDSLEFGVVVVFLIFGFPWSFLAPMGAYFIPLTYLLLIGPIINGFIIGSIFGRTYGKIKSIKGFIFFAVFTLILFVVISLIIWLFLSY